MAAKIISSLAPVTMTKSGGSSTVFAVENLGMSPAIQRNPKWHSGNRFPSIIHKPGAAPRVRFSTPFLDIYNYIGFSPVKLTAFAFYMAKFVDAIKAATSVHEKYALTAGATAIAHIADVSISDRGIMMANVEVIPLSSTASAHPLTRTSDNALPTLAAEPELSTLGPFTLNGGARLSGMDNVNIDLGRDFAGKPSDGDLYVRTVAEIQSQPMIKIAHDDPWTLLQSLGLVGTAISANAVLYFRDITETSGLTLDTGTTITVAAGTVDPEDVQMAQGEPNQAGFTICPLKSDDTHPFVVATGVAMPAA